MNSRKRNLRNAVTQDTRKLRRRSLRVPRAKIRKCAEENPDLTYALVQEILIGIEEIEQGASSEYEFG